MAGIQAIHGALHRWDAKIRGDEFYAGADVGVGIERARGAQHQAASPRDLSCFQLCGGRRPACRLSLVSYLWVPRTVTAWTSVIGAIAILGAGQLFVLGVIGEYIGRTLREARKWRSYVISETEVDLAGTESVPSARQRRTVF